MLLLYKVGLGIDRDVISIPNIDKLSIVSEEVIIINYFDRKGLPLN